MASFNGTISYEGAEPSQAHVDQAIRHAMDVRMLKTQAGQSRAVKSFDLPDGAQVYVLDYEHVWKVHIVPPTGYAVETFEPPEPGADFPGDFASIAGFVSGTTTSGVMDFKEVDWQFPDTPGAPEGQVPAARIVNGGLMSESAELFTKEEAEHKLGIPPWVSFSLLGDETPRTQFQFVKPGHYTGAMAPLVQLFLGLGRQVNPDYEHRWIAADPENRARVALDNKMDRYGPGSGGSEVTTGSDVSVYYQQPEDDLEPYAARAPVTQISYDPRWNRTHGIIWGKDADGEDVPFIVEVANRGVSFMPVAIDPFSKTKKGRERYEEVYPALAKYTPFRGGSESLFDAFGGFPIAENIPGASEEFERAKRAGKVIGSATDASEFYGGTMSACTWFGWAFHPSAPRAMNTGYRYVDSKKIGVCYEARFEVNEKSDSQKVRNSHYDQTVAALGLRNELDLFKAARLPDSFAQQMIDNPDYDTFDAFEVSPDWIVSCKLHKLKEGEIDYPYYQCPQPPGNSCDIIGSPHFKYYEPLLGEVLSFHFYNDNRKGEKMDCDGPIFCTYTTKGAEILSYAYRTPDSSPGESYNTRMYCQYTGQWTVGTRSEVDRIAGYFYSTSKDFRKQIAFGSGYHEVRTAYRTGYTDFLSFCAFFAMHGTCSRRYYGYQTWERENWGGKSYHASVICASDNRSAFLVCAEDMKSGITRSRGQGSDTMIGSSGHTRHGHLYNFYFHWISVCRPGDYPSGAPTTGRFTIHLERPGVDPCFGSDMPADPGYYHHPMHGYTVSESERASSFDGKSGPPHIVVQSARYNDNTATVQDSWSENDGPPYREFKWEVWGMGLDLMNAVKLREGEEIFEEGHDPQTVPIRASHTSWWRCSIPGQCPSPPYWVSANYYGKPFVSTYQDIDMSGIKTFGAKLSVPFGPATIPFGVVE